MGQSRGRVMSRDAIELALMAFGGLQAFKNMPVLIRIINVNSPMRFDDWTLGGLIACAQAGQVNVITLFIAAGAMGPITVAGAIAQQNAEAVVGFAFQQLVYPGVPVVYGNFTVDAHMKSGSPSLALPKGPGRHWPPDNLPVINNCFSQQWLLSSNIPEAQAAYETMM